MPPATPTDSTPPANDADQCRPFSGTRVLELGSFVSAPYCGKLLADLGADVIKVEAPGGDDARLDGPFPKGHVGDPERSALFLYLNTNKRSVVCDPSSDADREQLKELLRWADVVIDNRRATELPEILRWESLQSINPSLVSVSITPYGLMGPAADMPGDELTAIHAGGLANLFPTRCRSIESPPVKLGGYQASYQSAIFAAFVTASTLFGQRNIDAAKGQLIDVSMQDVAMALASPAVALWRYNDLSWRRVPDRPPAMGRMETSDGYIILNAFDDHHFEIFRGIMGNPEWCSGDEWKSMAYRNHHLMDIAPMIDAWALTQEKEALHRRAGEARIPNGPINDAADVLAYRQYAARNYFVDVDHPVAGTQRYPGLPYKFSGAPSLPLKPAPQLDEHQDVVKTLVGNTTPAPSSEESSSPAESSSVQSAVATTKLPLDGVRVLEFAWVWAGPYAGLLLASLGAEVIKVESHKRQDLMRRSFVWPLPDSAPSSIPTNQGMAYNAMNMNKKAITLDLSTEAGAQLALDLAKTADVVFDNMRPGALDRLGLGQEALRALNDQLIVASSSGRGHGGPETEYLGYAMPHQGIGGGAYITGHPDEPPCHSLGDIDIMNAATLAYSIVAALNHRESTGLGQFIDYSQCEGVTSLLGEMLIGFQMTGETPERIGNRHHRHAPHNVYPAWGVDRWLAISVHSDPEFEAFTAVLGRPELATDERFANATARKQNEDALDALIAEWTRERDRDWIVDEFQKAQVRAAPSREARDLWVDGHLRARGAFKTVEHPELGKIDLVDAPFRIEGIEHRATTAPQLGQHTDAVLSELLGLSAAAIDQLRTDEIIL